MYSHLSRFEIAIELFAPFETPHEALQAELLTGEPNLNHAINDQRNHNRLGAAFIAIVAILKTVKENLYH